MDAEEKKRLKELSQLEEKYGDLAEKYDTSDQEDMDMPMPMQGASLRDVDRIKEKRRGKKK